MVDRDTPIEINQVEQAFPEFSKISFVGQGGYKIVFKVFNGKSWEALKLFELPDMEGLSPEDLDEVQHFRQRFERELTIIKNCSALPLVKFGLMNSRQVSINGRDFVAYTEEFLDGETLRQCIDRKFVPSPSIVNELLHSLVTAINCLWELPDKIIHRDVKPDNIIMTNLPERPFVLLDLGLAFSPNLERLTENRAARPGTRGYHSPEMLISRLDIGKDLNFASDLHAAAVTTYEFATGKHPLCYGVRREDFESAIIKTTPAQITQLRADIPYEFADLLAQLMRKKPHLRGSCASISDQLKRMAK